MTEQEVDKKIERVIDLILKDYPETNVDSIWKVILGLGEDKVATSDVDALATAVRAALSN